MSLFALIDCNNFYCSCERVFKPSLQNRPVVVLSNNDGCIISRSQEAKELGVAMAAPYFKIRDQLARHNVAVYSSNYALYGDMSARVMEVLSGFSPELEIYSIDEAFIKLSARDAGLGPEIRKRVLQWTGIPVSVGISETKTLAKLAASRAKRGSGVAQLSADDHEILRQTPLSDIWGIGRRSSKKLLSYGINNADDFRRMDDGWIRAKLTVTGLRTAHELRGTPCLELEHHIQAPRSVTCSRSFCRRVTSLNDLLEASATYAENAGQKLRQKEMAAGCLQVYAQRHEHIPGRPSIVAASFSLDTPTQSTPEFIRLAHRGIRQIFESGTEYKKAGIILSDLTPAGSRQLNLFSQTESDDQLMSALDSLNQKWGRGTLIYGGSGLEKKWDMRRQLKSPSYTTNWNELPKAK